MKGVELPFQLLVSVAAMLVLFVLVSQVIEHSRQEQCDLKWDAALDDIASLISQVYHAAAPTKQTVRYDLRCGSPKKFSIKLIAQGDQKICGRVCGVITYRGCAYLEINVYDVRGHLVSRRYKCVEGATEDIFVGEGTCPPGTSPVDLSKGADLKPFGSITVKKQLSNEDEEVMYICVR